jgi:hypothetical protein
MHRMELVLGTLEQVPPRSVWVNEARDFTPWLAANLNVLGVALGLDLELTCVESAVGSYSCDIEAIEKGSGRRVIIENQLEQTDHSHLGQLLTYAAGLDAAIVVWISTKVREEHREAIDFLNRHTREGIDFFAITLELVRIGSSLPAVVFNLAASPNVWAKSASTAIRSANSDKMMAYQNFFQPLIDELRDTHRFTNAKLAQPQSWYSFSAGTTGTSFGVSFSGKGELRTELYIDVGDTARNKAIFDFYFARRDVLEAEIGTALQWERLEAKKASRIAVARQNTSIEDASIQGDAMRAWAIENLLRFKRVLGAQLKSAVQASTVGSSADNAG